MSRPWRVGLFDFGSGSGRVWPKSSGFGSGSGIVHILVSRLILLTLCVILQGASKKILLWFNSNWTIISVGQFQMPFKVVGQNRWVIWNCFGSTKNCHPCCLVLGMPYLKIVFFLLGICYQQPRLSKKSWSQVHFKAIFFSALFNFCSKTI